MSNGNTTYQQPDRPTAERVEDLLERMTTVEKAGQLVGTWAGHLGMHNDLDDVKRAVSEAGIGVAAPFGWGGATFREAEAAAEAANELQRVAREETRLGIPLLLNVDAVHGNAYVAGATVFPNGLGAAATWDPDLVGSSADITASEIRRVGAHQNYAPTCDVARSPRWGRTFETFGESPRLCAAMVRAAVRGYQGDGLEGPESVVATAKHFPAYSEPERGEDASPVDVSEYKLRNTFLPPFEAALAAGVESVMPSYNSINGEPSHGSKYALTDLLRGELGFEGYTVSDWNGVRHLSNDHGTAADRRDGIRQARQAGLDVESVGHVEAAEHLRALVESGDLDESLVDESVRRLLRVKFELGLFEDPYVETDAVRDSLATDDHRSVARDAARESMTLLSNDDLLPLSGNEDVFLGGPNADNLIHQLGGWSVNDPEGVPGTTIREGLADRLNGDLTYEQGTTLNETLDVDAAVEAAADADVAVLALGEGWYLHEFGPQVDAGTETGEWPTRSELRLSAAQRELVDRVLATETPVVGVLVTGRPLIVDRLAADAEALLMAYFPGTEGGAAVAETLLGDNNPSGRLPISVPRSMGDLPQHHDYLAHPTPIGQDEHPDSYDPLFAFGHGLSYTEFVYDAATSDGTVAPDGTVEVDVQVSNVGERDGTETVQVYARQLVSSRVRPERSLVGFDRVHVPAGETVEHTVHVPASALGYVHPTDGHVVESGEYRLFVDDHEMAVEVE